MYIAGVIDAARAIEPRRAIDRGERSTIEESVVNH
jgi:hypothetical protein